MKLEYKGKSKDVYALDSGNILMKFGDAFTGANGVEDPGANQNIGTKEGLGRRNLAVSTFLYEEIAKNLGIPTHHVKVDLDKGEVEAIRAVTLGRGMTFDGIKADGMEFIARNLAWGSFLKRFPSATQGMIMPDAPFTEVSIKNDDANDPFFDRATYIKEGVKAEHYDTALDYLRRITIFLTMLFEKKGLELVDIKMEFGSTADGKVILIDEISPGSLRALIDGKPASKEEIYSKLMG